ncbi:MAG TPA: ferritin-like domain-containing protein [Methylibium sp.]
MDLRRSCLQALALADVSEKLAAVAALWDERRDALSIDADAPLASQPDLPALPGRPPLPRLVDPGSVPQRSPFTTEGRAALLHAIAHIEFNAINLALDAVWRFAGMPSDYYRDWLRVAKEEAYHFGLLREHLRSLGRDYGDFDAHDGLWAMAEKTRDDIVARMALVPRTLEARGLDASPAIQAKLAKAGDARAVEILAIILRDEVGHVAIGNHWYRWLCEREGLDPVAHYSALTRRHEAPRLKPPFNDEARLAAGFTEEELAWLRGV